jgi:hypothetical protein
MIGDRDCDYDNDKVVKSISNNRTSNVDDDIVTNKNKSGAVSCKVPLFHVSVSE